jgi:hypothetical protein
VVDRKLESGGLSGGQQRFHAERRGHLVHVPEGVDQLDREPADVGQQGDLDALDVEVRGSVGSMTPLGEERGVRPQKSIRTAGRLPSAYAA